MRKLNTQLSTETKRKQFCVFKTVQNEKYVGIYVGIYFVSFFLKLLQINTDNIPYLLAVQKNSFLP